MDCYYVPSAHVGEQCIAVTWIMYDSHILSTQFGLTVVNLQRWPLVDFVDDKDILCWHCQKLRLMPYVSQCTAESIYCTTLRYSNHFHWPVLIVCTLKKVLSSRWRRRIKGWSSITKLFSSTPHGADFRGRVINSVVWWHIWTDFTYSAA